MQKLSNSIQLAHCLLKDRLNEAKIIVDATAGNGNDTLFLAQNALNNAQIYAFDIQKEAIENVINKIFVTKAGTEIAKTMFL